MKKLFIALMACAAIVSCSKSDITYDEQPQEIGLAAFSKKNTKAAVDGTDYPDALNMFVFAKIGEANATVPTGFTDAYLDNAVFGHRSDLNKDVFGGIADVNSTTANPYYWPNVKKLIFGGYSNSGNVSAMTTKPTHTLVDTNEDNVNDTYQITIDGYEPGKGTTTLGDNDLMWFPTTTTSYGKQTAAVEVEMKHACSWITINIQGDKITGATNTSWKIKSLILDELVNSGNAALTTEAKWTLDEATENVTLFTSNDGKALTESFVDYTGIENNIKVGEYYNLVVIPQDVRNLTLTYEYSPQSGITASEPKEISLAYDEEETAWQPGVHYIYNITIGTSEILIQPTVENWVPNENNILL